MHIIQLFNPLWGLRGKMGHTKVKNEEKVVFETQHRWTSSYARDRDSKYRLTYNELAYKKTKDYCKLEDRIQKKGNFSIAYT